MSDWKNEVPQKDGWYWFKPDGGKPSPYNLDSGRLIIVCSMDRFDLPASVLKGEWNHKEIKVPK